MYAHVKTMKVINDVRPVGEMNDVDGNVLDEFDKPLLEWTSFGSGDSVDEIAELSLTIDWLVVSLAAI